MRSHLGRVWWSRSATRSGCVSQRQLDRFRNTASVIAALVSSIARDDVDDVDADARALGLERLFVALQPDDIPWIESLGKHRGAPCVSRDGASDRADRRLALTHRTLGPDRQRGEFFKGSSGCLIALCHDERFDKLIALVSAQRMWDYTRRATKSMTAAG